MGRTMTRLGMAKLRARRTTRRPGLEILEDRSLPSGIGFISGLGIGVNGQYSTIRSNAVATDAAGDTLITGSFRGTAAFDPSSSSATFTTNNTQDTFVAKYGPTGSLIWAKTFAGQETTGSGGNPTYAVSQGSALAIDSSGDVFVTGGFSGSMNLTTATGVTTLVGPASTTEVYVAKLNPSGNVVWADAVLGTTYDTDEAYAIALDGSGGAVIAGSFQDSATFGSTTLTAGGQFEAFAARVDVNGNFLWAVASQGSNGSNAEIHGVAVDGSGHVDLAGFFSGTVNFSPNQIATNLVSAGNDDALLWKLDINGHVLWAHSYGSVDYDAATSIAVDASGNVYATGAFSDTVVFGGVSHPDAITAGPIFDTFVLKLDTNGNEIWAKGFVGPGGWSKGQGIAVDPFGNIHIAGTFQGLVNFNPNSGTDNLTSVGNTDVFVAGLNSVGNLLYALQAGKTNFNGALGVAVNVSGTVAVTGTDSGAIAFGAINVPAIGLASLFVAQVTTQLPPPSAPSVPILEASSDSGSSHNDGITNDTSPIFDVNTADPSNTVELPPQRSRRGSALRSGRDHGPGARPRRDIRLYRDPGFSLGNTRSDQLGHLGDDPHQAATGSFGTDARAERRHGGRWRRDHEHPPAPPFGRRQRQDDGADHRSILGNGDRLVRCGQQRNLPGHTHTAAVGRCLRASGYRHRHRR